MACSACKVAGLALLLSLLLGCLHCVAGSWWLLGMPSTYQNMLTLKPSAHSENCHKLRSQVKEQRDLCVLSHKALQTVSRGAKLGIDECQHQFRTARWNCTTFSNIPSVFGGVLTVMSREKAYVYAVSAAGVAYSITRACSKGELAECGCDNAIRQRKPRGAWQWGGCSDDIAFGAQFSRKFVDTGEDPMTPQGLMNRQVRRCHPRPGDARRQPRRRQAPPTQTESRPQARQEARQEGPRLPRRVSRLLYARAVSLPFFVHRLAVLGTVGRACNKTSYGLDGCRLLCCGRGYQTVVRELDEKCHCKFVWCCKVQCQTCRVTREEQYCK